MLLVAEKSYSNVLTFLCHKRYDIFLAKISLNFSLAKLKNLMDAKYGFVSPRVCAHKSQPTGNPDVLCSLEDWWDQGGHGILQMLIHEIELSCWERGKLGGLNESCLVCIAFSVVILGFPEMVFCKYFWNLMQNGR